MVLKNFIWVIVQFKCDEKPKSILFHFFLNGIFVCFKTFQIQQDLAYTSRRLEEIQTVLDC